MIHQIGPALRPSHTCASHPPPPLRPCLHRWTDEYLTTLSEHFVSVNVTPNGRADAVDEEGRFVKPLEERMSFQDWGRRRMV